MPRLRVVSRGCFKPALYKDVNKINRNHDEIMLVDEVGVKRSVLKKSITSISRSLKESFEGWRMMQQGCQVYLHIACPAGIIC